MTDWTEQYDKTLLSHQAKVLVDNIIDKICNKNLNIYSKHQLSNFELSLLYRWPIYVGVNIFFERLIRVIVNNKPNDILINNFEQDYFGNTVKSVQAYYYDFSINYQLLNDLSDIIFNTKNNKKLLDSIQTPQEQLQSASKSHFFIKTLKTIFINIEKIYIKCFKPKLIGENSNWFRKMFFFGNSIDFYGHNFLIKENIIDIDTREELKEIFINSFINHNSIISNQMNNEQINKCSKIFGEWVDHILPLSIIEGFDLRFDYYEKMLKNWSIEQVHSFTGFYYNDNFKVFAMLAKRKGAKFIGHTHGARNYLSLCMKERMMLCFLDYYTTYGMNKVDEDLQNTGIEHLKFIPTGSTDFNSVQKWKKAAIVKEDFILLYPSGPLMDFMSDLIEISPEENLKHRLRILNFLEHLLENYPGLKIYYKPFPGTFTNDPIKKQFLEWFNKGRIQLIERPPKKLYNKVDIVLWDTISTGFGEAVTSGVPTFVFNSNHEYKQTSPRGKIVNDALTRAQIQSFDETSAIKAFEKIINDIHNFKKDSNQAIKMFMNDMANPVSKKEWFDNFQEGLSS